MRTEYLGPNPGQICQKSVVTIGNFDGVHQGHRALLSQAVQLAHDNSCSSAVMTFFPHPKRVLRPEIAPVPIYQLSDEQELIARLGIDVLAVQKFDRDFAETHAIDFMKNYIQKLFNPVGVVVGHDFAFGKDREGSLEALRQFTEENRIHLSVVSPVRHNGNLVSSTRIRSLLELGHVREAHELLVDPFFMSSNVCEGRRLGQQLGVRTANFDLESCILKKGVYATRAKIGDESYFAISNLGVQPTIEKNGRLKLETHLFNFDQDIYHRRMTVEFIDFIRGEENFSDLESLRRQIHNDLKRAREIHGILS